MTGKRNRGRTADAPVFSHFLTAAGREKAFRRNAVNRQKGVPFFATRDGPICATCGIPLSISIPFIWVSRNCGQKLPEVWQSIGLSDLITLLRLRRHLSRMAMPLAKSLTDAV